MTSVRLAGLGQPSLEDVLRADPELRRRAKAIGAFKDTIARIESDDEDDE